MIVPLVVFFASGALIDTSPVRDGESINAAAYFGLVIARVVLMSVAIGWFGKEILRQFPWSVDRWGWLVGVAGAAVWIGVCGLEIERSLAESLGLSEDCCRSARASIHSKPTAPDGRSAAFWRFDLPCWRCVFPSPKSCFYVGL